MEKLSQRKVGFLEKLIIHSYVIPNWSVFFTSLMRKFRMIFIKYGQQLLGEQLRKNCIKRDANKDVHAD